MGNEIFSEKEVINILSQLHRNNRGKFTKYKCIKTFLSFKKDWVSIKEFKNKYFDLFKEKFSLTYLENLFLKYKIIDSNPKIGYPNFFKMGSKCTFKLLYKDIIHRNMNIITPNKTYFSRYSGDNNG